LGTGIPELSRVSGRLIGYARVSKGDEPCNALQAKALKAPMQMVGSFAQFERAMIRERTSAGLALARAEGRVGGHRRVVALDQQTAGKVLRPIVVNEVGSDAAVPPARGEQPRQDAGQPGHCVGKLVGT